MNSLSVGGCVPIVSLRQLLQCGAWGDIVIGSDNFDQGVYAFVLASGNADVAIDLSCWWVPMFAALAFQQFYSRRPGQQVIWEQDETYPCEACCHRGQ